jgi:putative transposase
VIHPAGTILGVISSNRTALTLGSSKLVVDGTDDTLCRKAEISLSPERTRARALDKLVDWSRDVYNGALQHRRDAWHLQKVAISRFDQFSEVPSLRPVCPEVARFGNQPARGAISRADEAFAAFFRRVGDGEKSGYPRFKSRNRLRTVFYDEPTNWRLRNLEPGQGPGGHPALYVQGVGEIPLSKKAVSPLRGSSLEVVSPAP